MAYTTIDKPSDYFNTVLYTGNGSSNAGSKRLYAMMDQVREARTGTEKQGKEINPERYMPA